MRVILLAVGLVLGTVTPAWGLGATTSELVVRLCAGLDLALSAVDPRSIGYAVVPRIPDWPSSGARLVEVTSGLLQDRLEALLRSRGAASPLVAPLVAPGDHTQEAASALGDVQGFDLVLLVELEVTRGHVELRAAAVRGRRSFWDKAQGIGGGTVASSFARARLDVELRSLLGQGGGAARLSPRLSPLAAGSLPPQVLALAVCDVDGDGRDDVAALGRRSLAVLQPHGSALRPSLDALPGAEAPSRWPVGSLVSVERQDGGCDLLAATTSLGEVAIIRRTGDGDLRVTAVRTVGMPLSGSLPEGGVLLGELTLGEARLAGPRWLWEPGAGARPLAGTGAEWSQRVIVKQAASGEVDVLEVRSDGGSLDVVGGSSVQRRSWSLGARGLPALVADLDDDGIPEVLVTSTAVPPGGDRAELVQLAADGAVRSLWSADTPPIRAAAVGDPDDDGELEVVLAVAASPGADRLLLLEVRGSGPGARGP